MLLAIANFLQIAAALAGAQGGNPSDLSKLLHMGFLATRAGAVGKAELEKATAKMKELVAEKRGLTPEEDAALDLSIREKIAAAAAVNIDDDDNDSQGG